MEAVGYSCLIRLVPTYILPAIEIRLSGWFHTDSFKTEILVMRRNGQTDRRT